MQHLNSHMQLIYEAISKNDYQKVRELLSRSGIDVNSYGASEKGTPLGYAIWANKPVYVELFLLMGANPNVPISVEDERIKSILSSYRPEKKYSTDEAEIEAQFIQAIHDGDVPAIQQMLNDGFAYRADKIFGTSRAIMQAIKSQSFDVVALLVEKGAMLGAESDLNMKAFLKKNAGQSWCKPMIELFNMEKEKQNQIMQVFCKDQGNLEACRHKIKDIKDQFTVEVNKIRPKNEIQDRRPKLTQTQKNKLTVFVDKLKKHVEQMPKKDWMGFHTIHTEAKDALLQDIDWEMSQENPSFVNIKNALTNFYHAISTQGGYTSQRHKNEFNAFLKEIGQGVGMAGIANLTIDALPEALDLLEPDVDSETGKPASYSTTNQNLQK